MPFSRYNFSEFPCIANVENCRGFVIRSEMDSLPDAGRLYGPPENCYPPSDAHIIHGECPKCCHCGAEIPADKRNEFENDVANSVDSDNFYYERDEDDYNRDD